MATATARVDIDLDYKAILRLQVSTSHRLSEKAAKNIQRRARRHAPKRSGYLASTIEIYLREIGPKTTYDIGSSADYAPFQEWGTGPIYPRSAHGVLVFEVGGRTVFARSTSGVPATHFMAKAARTITIADFV